MRPKIVRQLTLETQMLPRVLFGAAMLGITAAGPGLAQNIPTWSDVQPIFEAHCYGCHGTGGGMAHYIMAGLSLTTYDLALKGSRNGEVLVAGDPEASVLVKRLTGEMEPQMPRDREPLSSPEISLIIAWIAGGLRP